MRCPWREHVYVDKSSRNIHKYTNWEECYKEECPFWVYQLKYRNGNSEKLSFPYCKRMKDDPT